MEPVVVGIAKKTRRGNIYRSIKQHYLRNDIQCGYSTCIQCGALNNPPLSSAEIYILDAPTLISHITVLEEQYQSPVLTPLNTLFLQSSLSYIKSHDQSLYKRLTSFIEESHYFIFMNEHRAETYVENSIRDREFMCCIKAAEYLGTHLAGVTVRLISDKNGGVQLEDLMRGTAFVDMFPICEETSERIYTDHLDIKEASKHVKQGDLYEGVLHVYRSSPDSAWVRINRLTESPIDIAIQGIHNMNRAIDGDVVAVQIINEPMDTEENPENLDEIEGVDIVIIKPVVKEVKPHREGRVISVLKTKNKAYCGSFRRTGHILRGRELCIFSPVNPKLSEVKIYLTNPSRLENMRITVCIDEWKNNSELPQGHLVKVLGEIEDIKTESDVILLEHDVIIKPFTQAALNCLPSRDWVLSEEEINKRTDLRDRCVASVDPPGCKDIDDALHCKILPNGNLEVGVHIADVTHFVLADLPLDLEASERCTTVYLVERRTDMLPGILTEVLCSLVSNVDRLAFSVL